MSGCSHRAKGRINSRGSNRCWMKVQWQVMIARPRNNSRRALWWAPLGESNAAQQASGSKGFLKSQDCVGQRFGAVRAFDFSEKHLQRRIFFPDGPPAHENSGVMPGHYPNWRAEARQLGFKLCFKIKRH